MEIFRKNHQKIEKNQVFFVKIWESQNLWGGNDGGFTY